MLLVRLFLRAIKLIFQGLGSTLGMRSHAFGVSKSIHLGTLGNILPRSDGKNGIAVAYLSIWQNRCLASFQTALEGPFAKGP